MKKVRLHEGDVFLVPLSNGGYVRGLAARYNKRSGFVFGFFFGPQYKKVEEATCILIESQRMIAIRFYETSLVNGEWPVIGRVEPWDRSKWPTPDGMIKETLIGQGLGWRIRWSDDDPVEEDSRVLTEFDPLAMTGGSTTAGGVLFDLDKLFP